MEKVLYYYKPGALSDFAMGPCTDLIWLVKLAGLAAILVIFYLRRSRHSLDATYWLAALAPGIVGIATGLYMFYDFVFIIGRAGYVGPTPPEWFEIRAVFVMHYGLFLSGLLALVILYLFYGRYRGTA